MSEGHRCFGDEKRHPWTAEECAVPPSFRAAGDALLCDRPVVTGVTRLLTVTAEHSMDLLWPGTLLALAVTAANVQHI